MLSFGEESEVYLEGISTIITADILLVKASNFNVLTLIYP